MNNGFEAAFQKTVIENEGVYDNDPQDPGGETVFGINKRDHPNWPGWKRLEDLRHAPLFPSNISPDHLMMELVRDYYRSGPWTYIHGDELLPEIAAELFDSAVNCGETRTIQWFQRALNIFNRGGTDYPDMKVDGIMGAGTVQAFVALESKRGSSLLLKALNALQGVRYIEIAEKNPALEKFQAGWWRTRIS